MRLRHVIGTAVLAVASVAVVTPAQGQTCDLVPGARCAGADLSGANLAGLNLEGSDFTGANLTGANLTGAVLAGSKLTGTTLTNANFTNADLREVGFRGAGFANTTLSGARILGTHWFPSNLLEDAKASSALYDDFALMTDAEVHGGCISPAGGPPGPVRPVRPETSAACDNMRPASMREPFRSHYLGWGFSAIDGGTRQLWMEVHPPSQAIHPFVRLSGHVNEAFTELSIDQVDNYRPHLGDTDWVGTTDQAAAGDVGGPLTVGIRRVGGGGLSGGGYVYDVRMSGWMLRRDRAIPASPTGPQDVCEPGPAASCPGADLAGRDLHGRDLTGADLSGANLAGADLHGTTLMDTDLTGADLRYATFRNATFRNTRLAGARILGTRWFPSNLLADETAWRVLFDHVLIQPDLDHPGGSCSSTLVPGRLTPHDDLGCRQLEPSPLNTPPFDQYRISYEVSRPGREDRRDVRVRLGNHPSLHATFSGWTNERVSLLHVTRVESHDDLHGLWDRTTDQASPGHPGGPLRVSVLHGTNDRWLLQLRGWLLRQHRASDAVPSG